MSDTCTNYIEIWGRRKSERVPGGTRFWWDAECYTWADCGDGASVRDERHTNEIVGSLKAKSSQWRAEKPVETESLKPWFTVALEVSGTRRKVSHYSLDYRAHLNCPLTVRGWGMDIYRLIKRNIKRAIKKGEAK